MDYAVTTRTGKTLTSNGEELDALREVCKHPAPDALTVHLGSATMNGAKFLRRVVSGETLDALREEWPGDEEARELVY